MKRILIVRLGSLGDIVHTLPAAAAIRRAYSDAVIDWLVDAPHAPFLALAPVVTQVIVLRSRSLGGWLAVRREMRQRHYDVALDFQGLVKSAALAWLSGAGRVMGFNRGALRERLAAMFYNRQVEVPARHHVIDKNLALAQAVLMSAALAEPPQFPVEPGESAALESLRQDLRGEPFLLMNPGAAWPNKRWPAERFGQVAGAVWAQHRLRTVVLWGPGERALAEDVVASSNHAAVLAPPTDLRDLVAIGRAARLVVSGDTGPLHVACASGTPAVALFGPTDPARNGPWLTDDITLSQYQLCACHYQRACTRASGPCLNDISVDQVLGAIAKRLETSATLASSSRS